MRPFKVFLTLSALVAPIFATAAMEDQRVIVPSINDDYTPQTTPQPTLADLLTIEPSVSIFYGYVRELELSATLSEHNANIAVFAPLNKAVIALPRKPNQGPEPHAEIEISEEGRHLRAVAMVKRWVAAHIVPGPLTLDDKRHKTLLDHKSISFRQDKRSSDWFVVDGDNSYRILHEKQALNGVLYVIDGAISTKTD